MPSPPGLRLQLILITVVTSAVALLVALTSLSLLERSNGELSEIEELEALARLVATAAAPTLAIGDQQATQNLTDSLDEDLRLFSAKVVGADGTILALSKPTAHAEEPAGLLASPPGLTASAPIVLDDSLLGRVVLERRTAISPDIRRPIAFLLASLAGVTLAVVLSTFLHRLIARPIRHLLELAKRVSETSDYTLRAEVTASNEVGALAESFNAMLQQIDSRNEALNRAHADLERRVSDRTMELEVHVAEREHAEKELLRYSNELLKSNRDLEDFAYVASHDLQEPLRKIEAFGSYLEERIQEAGMDEVSLDYLARMRQAATRMRALINDLLTFSRLSTHSNRQSLDLNELLAEVRLDLAHLLESSSATLIVGELPTVRGTPVQIKQLFQNLILNAIKFHAENRSPQIEVFAAVDSPMETGFCRIVVKDNGIGIEQQHREQIFGLFQRLHSRTDYEGTGIGLSICRKIVESHGGRIEVDSVTGEGSSFSVYLPLDNTSGRSGAVAGATGNDRPKNGN